MPELLAKATKISKILSLPFDIDTAGWHMLSVSARARWLYHKAQGIGTDGKRYWRPWNEAVQNYNSEGNVKYEKEVYGVYKNGLDKRNQKNPFKLWIIVFFTLSIGLAGSILGIYRYQNQGKMWLTFEDSKEERAALCAYAS